MYTTLRKIYKVPSENIISIISDGKDPSEDTSDDNKIPYSSPLDLDGDGFNDIQYSATKANIKE